MFEPFSRPSRALGLVPFALGSQLRFETRPVLLNLAAGLLGLLT